MKFNKIIYNLKKHIFYYNNEFIEIDLNNNDYNDMWNLLIYGEEGVGKKTFVNLLLKDIYCVDEIILEKKRGASIGGGNLEARVGTIDGKEIDDHTAELLQFELKPAELRNGDMQGYFPPKHLQLAAMEYVLKYIQEDLEKKKQTIEVVRLAGIDNLDIGESLG